MLPHFLFPAISTRARKAVCLFLTRYSQHLPKLDGPLLLSRFPILIVMIGILLSNGTTSTARVADHINIAPLTPYHLTPQPNYRRATGNPARVLNDGKRGWGRIWTGNRAIGWSWNRQPVVYRQKFKRETGISEIQIGTVSNRRSGISLPSSVLVYASGRNGRFSFIGDAGQTAWLKHWNNKNRNHTLRLQFKPLRTKEVIIIFFREGTYLFLDEIRIISSPAKRRISGTVSGRNILQKAAKKRRLIAEKRAGIPPVGTKKTHRLAWPLTTKSIKNIPPGCHAQTVNAWTESTPTAIIEAQPENNPSIHAVGGWLTGAIRITNNTDHPCRLSHFTSRNSGTGKTAFLAAGYVLSLKYKWYADVMIPITNSIIPAHSYLLLVTRARIKRTGKIENGIGFKLNGKKHSITIAGKAVRIAPGDRPHANLWAYLTGAAARIPRCQPDFFQRFWIDTAVIPLSDKNFSISRKSVVDLKRYLKAFSSTRRILFWLQLKHSGWLARVNNRQLEKAVRNWWNRLRKIIKHSGYKGEIVIYPMDEPTIQSVKQLNRVAKVLKKIAPRIKIYSTVGKANVLHSARLDIAQVHTDIRNDVPARRRTEQELQIYATWPVAKSVELTNGYRRLALEAFSKSMKGVGVWSLWDSSGSSHPETGWSDFGSAERDFGLIYADHNKCILSSRRLTAFQRGLEDYALLRSCQRRTGSKDLHQKIGNLLKNRKHLAQGFDISFQILLKSCIGSPASPGERQK